jgi:hypothetical protein
MTPHGPIYCETGHPWLGIAEPVNTVTNGFIFLAAILAFLYVRRARIGFPLDVSVLLLLLTVTAIGSSLWHGLRTMWALQLDWMPGALFLFVLAGLWTRQLFGRIAGVLGAVGLFAAIFAIIALSWRLTGGLPPQLRFVPMFATVTVAGLGLVFATAKKFGAREASLGALIIMFGVSAAIFRSIDLMMCDLIPFGTHFLWHLLLSTASALGIVLVVRMKKERQKSTLPLREGRSAKRFGEGL